MIKLIKSTLLLALLVVSACRNDAYLDESVYVYPEYKASYIAEADMVSRNGVNKCVVTPRCASYPMSEPEACSQPMPSYYQDITEPQVAEGVLLIHPYSRTKVLCVDFEGQSAVQCAENFRAKGYVLVTDIAQFPAESDLLKKGVYPARRWRDGEVVPRF